MGLQYPPRVGDIVECDWSRGFVEPEMVKRRLSVVMNNRLPGRDRLCSVVPLSTTPPRQGIRYQCKIILPSDPPPPYEGREKWAKADMIGTVSYDRCNFVLKAKPSIGKRQYYQARLDQTEMRKIWAALLDALGLQRLEQAL